MCPDRETLAAYVDRRLAAAERDLFEAHLAACDACRAESVDLWRLAKPRLQRLRPARSTPWGWAAAASLAAAALLAIGLSFRSPGRTVEPPVVVHPKPLPKPDRFYKSGHLASVRVGLSQIMKLSEPRPPFNDAPFLDSFEKLTVSEAELKNPRLKDVKAEIMVIARDRALGIDLAWHTFPSSPRHQIHLLSDFCHTRCQAGIAHSFQLP